MRCWVVPLLALSLGASALEQPQDLTSLLEQPQDAVVKQNEEIMDRMRRLEAHLAETASKPAEASGSGRLFVNGPLPADFPERFARAVAKATGADAKSVRLTSSQEKQDAPGVVQIGFSASPTVVKEIEDEAADPNSPLANGNLHSFLVAQEDDKDSESAAPAPAHSVPALSTEVTPVEEKGIDVDTQMPYGDLEPFGREDTAQELTEGAVKESDEMVDQLERAEVAEEKRAVFRALTRLRGAAITSFDGVARAQTGNIDEYNKVNKWRKSHPLHHLADEESDISKWAFPDNADLLQKSHK